MDGRVEEGQMERVLVADESRRDAVESSKVIKVIISLEESAIRLLASAIGAAMASGGRQAPAPMSGAVSVQGSVDSQNEVSGGVVQNAAMAKGVSPLPIPADRPPAVDPKASVLPDALICLEDGHRLTMLKRYLRSRFGLTPEQYRARWGLPLDYPMVAPRYAMQRSDIARRSGLGRNGRKRRASAAETSPSSVDVSATR